MNSKKQDDSIEPSNIVHDLHEGLFTIRLNRPEKLNAMGLEDFDCLLKLLEEFKYNNQAKVLILTGTGRAFCSGEDLSELLEPEEMHLSDVKNRTEKLQTITDILYNLDKPTIAAINGIAVGFGLEVTLACDLRIASSNAYFWFSEVIRGMVPTNGAFYLLPRLIGTANTARMMLLSEKIDANKALEFRLISEITAEGEVNTKAEYYAHKLMSYSQYALHKVKKMLREAAGMNLQEVLDMEVEGILAMAEQGEIQAGAEQFAQRNKQIK